MYSSLAARLAEEGHEHQTAHVEGGEHRHQHSHSEEDGIGFQRHGEDLVLGVESAEGRQTGQGGGAHLLGVLRVLGRDTTLARLKAFIA